MPVRPRTITRRRVDVAQPGVGLEWLRTNDSGRLWLVRAVAFRFVTSAVVANRSVGIRAQAAEDVWFRTTPATTQVASLTRDYHAWQGAPAGGDSPVAIRVAWPTPGLWVALGESVGSQTDLIDAGDQYSRIFMDLVEYPDDGPTSLIPSPYHDLGEIGE